MSLDRDTITLGESVTLTMTFEGGSITATPALPRIPNLTFSGRIGQSMNTVNGQVIGVTHLYTVKPTQAGQYVIPAMTGEIAGRPAISEPVKLTVLPATETKTAFLRLVVPKTEVYLGEVVPLELYVFYQSANGSEAPKIKEEGFTLGKLVQSQQSVTNINGMQFNIFPIKTWVVPAKVGDLPLGPATMNISIPAPGARINIFRSIVDWQAVTLQSEPQTLHVLPLPSDNVPAGFSGAVGAYKLGLSANPTNVAVGDPITISIQVAGRGAVDAVTLPEQKNWKGFKLYPPTSSFEANQTDPLGLLGVKTFKLTAVPESMDVKELPPFAFSYFDPEQKKYQTLSQPAVPLIVRPSAASLPPPNLSTLPGSDNTSSGAGDIAHIKARPGVLATVSAPLAAQPWFIVLQAVPAIAWISLLINRRQKEKLAGNPRLRRQRLVDRIVHDGSKQLKMAAQTNQPEEFYAILFRMLQEQLGERLDMPASAITEAVVDERLRPLAIPAETLALIAGLFQACNQARYSRQDSQEELTALASDFERAVDEIRRIRV